MVNGTQKNINRSHGGDDDDSRFFLRFAAWVIFSFAWVIFVIVLFWILF